MTAAIKIQFCPAGVFDLAEVPLKESNASSDAAADAGRWALRVAPPERLPNVLRTLSSDVVAASSAEPAEPTWTSCMSDAACAGACESGREMAEGGVTTEAYGKLITLPSLAFSGVGAFFRGSKLGVMGAGGAGVIVDAAGCTCSCRPIEMKDGSGLVGESICGSATAGLMAGENDVASAGFSVTAGAGAGAQEISDADAAGACLTMGTAGAGAAGCAGLFAVAGPSEGK